MYAFRAGKGLHTCWLLRLKNFFLSYFAIGALLRILFTIQASPELNINIMWALLLGLGFDFAVALCFLVPIAIIYTFCFVRKNGQYAAVLFTKAMSFILIFIWLSIAIAEWFFWGEFQARFNFIAVDYLIYTHEVIGNIRESYSVGLIIFATLIASIVITIFGFKDNYYPFKKPVLLSYRLSYLLIYTFTLILTLQITSSDGVKLGSPYLNEIAKNGVYELFKAYKRNELSYEKFYVTYDADILLNHLQEGLGIKAKQPDIKRFVKYEQQFKPYNIMLITVESLNASFMNAFGNNENITPNLDAIAKDGLLFKNCYAIGTRTVYGLTALSLSIPPLPGNAIIRRVDNENLLSMASVLNQHNYLSKFIYGGFGYFDNMNYFFSNNGYEVVDRNNFTSDEITFSNIWGVADEDIFNKVIKESDKAYLQGRPFFYHIMTTSNHRPYTYPEGRIDIPSYTNRAGGVKYTDYAIGKFIKDVKNKPWFDNTIFVIVADHTAGSARKMELDPNEYHIPLIIYAPKIVKPAEVETITSQIDVAPTVFGLLNLSYNSKFFGVDVLNQKPRGSVFISNYQQLGFMKDDRVYILRPIKQEACYKKHDGNFIVIPCEADLKIPALSYFQLANNWRLWNNIE